MPPYRRFAVYDLGPEPLAQVGAGWLGWDARSGQAVPAGGGEWTRTPRRYGFHATIKAPFCLAEGALAETLSDSFAALCARLAPLALPRLRLTDAGGFLALMPQPQPQALTDLAADVVAALDPFRAPLSEAEIARRRPERLTGSQRANLHRWGYPHVMDDFRYHMTLTGDLDAEGRAAAQERLAPLLDPLLADPHPLAALALMGEDAEGRFHLIRRCALGG